MRLLPAEVHRAGASRTSLSSGRRNRDSSSQWWINSPEHEGQVWWNSGWALYPQCPDLSSPLDSPCIHSNKYLLFPVGFNKTQHQLKPGDVNPVISGIKGTYQQRQSVLYKCPWLLSTFGKALKTRRMMTPNSPNSMGEMPKYRGTSSTGHFIRRTELFRN